MNKQYTKKGMNIVKAWDNIDLFLTELHKRNYIDYEYDIKLDPSKTAKKKWDLEITLKTTDENTS